MNQDSYALEEIGIPVLPGNEIQIELFEKFLAALEARREVTFTQTRRGLKLRSRDLGLVNWRLLAQPVTWVVRCARARPKLQAQQERKKEYLRERCHRSDRIDHYWFSLSRALILINGRAKNTGLTASPHLLGNYAGHTVSS